MLLCGIDLETTGLNVETCDLTEIACQLYDTRRRRTVESFSTLVRLPKGVALPKEICALSNLDDELLQIRGNDLRLSLVQAFTMMRMSDAAVAHNATLFERKVLAAQARRLEMPCPELPWIDTAVDVEYGPHIRGKSLTHIAADHGFVNPFPHEAGPDVMTMLKVLSANDIEKALDNAKAPKVLVQALVTFDQKDVAKNAGFYFKPDSKQWLKTMRADRLADAQYPFQVKILPEPRP